MEMHNNLIVFDGECNFCNTAVNFIIRNDKKNKLKFIPFQSQSAKNILSELTISPGSLGSIIYIKNGTALYKSSAVLNIFKTIGGSYTLFYGLIIVPSAIRDLFYDLIAKNRHKLFKKQTTCAVASRNVRPI